MSSQHNLEIKGNLSVNPFAEIVAEIAQVGFDGSLRLASDQKKAIVYFNAGKVVFAVSNLKNLRLVELLSAKEKLAIKQNSSGANDLEIAQNLVQNGVFSKAEIDACFCRQIGEILKTVLSWREGEWIFSPLARVKENIEYKFDVRSLLIEHARSLTGDEVKKYFRSLAESFGVRPQMPAHVNLFPKESFVLSRFENSFLKIEEIKVLSGLSDAETLQVLYALWLGGFLFRQNWNSAFNDRKVSDILSAKLALKIEDDSPNPEQQQPDKPDILLSPNEANNTPPEAQISETEASKISLEEYLDQAEKATNFYETLGISFKAATAEIKKAYFSFAKQFHPDLYHRNVEPKIHQRVQNAFTKVAQAYNTLRAADTREVYDFKMRKEPGFAEHLKDEKSSQQPNTQAAQASQAAESFEHGYTYLLDERYEEALPFLGRAAYLANDNARYRAFYGKALSFDEKERFKAEAEIQAAIKLDPNNAVYRIILAEFFIQYKLPKRAEGELKRFLAIVPNNQEASALLDTLRQK